MKVVHYLNQFFAGLGAEEAARHEPIRLEGPQGPGKGLVAAGLQVDITLACGDDYFGEHETEALGWLLDRLSDEAPDVLICGPAFGSGRYGYACGVLGREAARRGYAVVTAMTQDNPGVIAAEGAAYIVPTTSNVAGMRAALPTIADLATRLANGETIGSPEEEGYLPRGLRRNEIVERTAAARAVELLLAKIGGETRTEVAPSAGRVTPAPKVADISAATIALVTESGCVPLGNPDRLPTRHSNVWLRYRLDGVGSLGSDGYESVHAGFDTTAANVDPNRLVPLDAMRELERENAVGGLYEELFTTSGVDTPVAVAATFGCEMAEVLVSAGVRAVILTGT